MSESRKRHSNDEGFEEYDDILPEVEFESGMDEDRLDNSD